MKNLKIALIATGLIALTSVNAQDQKQRERKTLEEKFQKLDINQDGNIDKVEFLKAVEMRTQKMAVKGNEPRKGNPEEKFAKIDADRNGAIDFNEFKLTAEKRKEHITKGERDPKQKFERIDADKNGVVSIGEYQTFLDKKAERAALNGKEVKKFDVKKRFIVMDANKDRGVDYNEFLMAKEKAAKKRAEKSTK
jgi:Ca2+-binding EF-hand superfamily protein